MPAWEGPCSICGAVCHYELDCWFGSSALKKKELNGDWHEAGERERGHRETHSHPHLLPRDSSMSPRENRMFGSQWFDGVGFGDVVQRIRRGLFPGNKEARERIRSNLQQGTYYDPRFLQKYIASGTPSDEGQDAVTFARTARVKTEAGEEQVPVKSSSTSVLT